MRNPFRQSRPAANPGVIDGEFRVIDMSEGREPATAETPATKPIILTIQTDRAPSSSRFGQEMLTQPIATFGPIFERANHLQSVWWLEPNQPETREKG